MPLPSPLLSAALLLPLQRLTPNQATLVGTLGLLLIFFEFNRPGAVLPGAVGLLFTLFAVAAFVHRPCQPVSVLALALLLLLEALNLYRALPAWSLGLCTLGLVAALHSLLPLSASSRVGWPVAALCGSLLGSFLAVLGSFARRARRAKALN